MGSLGSTARQVSFDSLVHKRGLNLSRGHITQDPGTFVLDPTVTTLRAGMMVAFNASGNLVLATGSNGVFGVAKWGSVDRDYAVKADEAIVLNGTTPTALSRSNISNVTVRSAPGQGGTLYTGGGGDYTVNSVSGTIERDNAPGASNIPDGGTVYVTYTYALTAADDAIDGNYFTSNTQNRTTGAVNRVAVIKPNSTIYSAAYAGTSATGWALTGTGHKVYCGTDALPTPHDGGTEEVGRVVQLPIADDPYLGWEFKGVI